MCNFYSSFFKRCGVRASLVTTSVAWNGHIIIVGSDPTGGVLGSLSYSTVGACMISCNWDSPCIYSLMQLGDLSFL
jgi:hypothetical protein